MVQIDAIDAASWRLIPLAYVNLKRLGVEDPLLLQAKEIRLYHWRCNQRLFQQSSIFLDQLQQLKIPVVVLKGVALAHLYYCLLYTSALWPRFCKHGRRDNPRTLMNSPPPKKTSQRRTLFLTHLCPSSAGSGPQIRAVALLRMLAARGNVHVLIVNRYRQIPGPCDPCADCGSVAMTYLRILPNAGTAGRWMMTANEVPYPELLSLIHI